MLINVPLAAANANATLTVQADARVEADKPTVSFGSAASIAADVMPQVESVLRFDATQLSVTVRAATLRLWTVTGAGTLPNVALASSSWDEARVTWNNRPHATTQPLAFSGATQPERWVSFDVSRLLRGASTGAVTFLLATERADQLAFSSREGAHAAELLVETTTSQQPTPSPTAAAAGAGMASPTPAQGSATASPTPVQNAATASPTSTQGSPTASPTASPTSSSTDGTTWYVSPSGTGGDGLSWGSAWNTFTAIQWSQIKPGDTVRIARATYTEPLLVSAQGSASKPIRILFEPGSVLFGGRSDALPGCYQQPTYTNDGLKQAIDLHAAAYITIDGQQWNGLRINGWHRGITIGSAHGITLRNMELTDNGLMVLESQGWWPKFHGITMDAASDVLIEHMNMHDNGADGIHAYGDITNITIRNTWFHNERGKEFNGCGHPDGLQIGTGFVGTSIAFERVVSGPNVYHTILSNNGGDNWDFEDVLVFQPLTSTFACRGTCRNLSFNRVTSDAGDSPLNFEVSGTGHRITNSILTNGTNRILGDPTIDNNYQWNLDGTRIGEDRDPQYQNLTGGNYAPRGHVNGAGSRVTSVAQLTKAAATVTLTVSPTAAQP